VSRQEAALLISVIALLISMFALGWNVYRDILLRPRMSVFFAAVKIGTPGPQFAAAQRFLQIRVTNLGPGIVTITGLEMRIAPLWRRLLRRVELYALLLPGDINQNSALPSRLEVSETARYYFRPEDLLQPGSRERAKVTHIGVHDSFGRSHFAPRAELRRLRQLPDEL
jgi:hypothetical protein